MSNKEIIEKELNEVAPRLPLRTHNPYQVPDGYFEQLPATILQKAQPNRAGKKDSIFILPATGWWLTAAACIGGILFLSIAYFNNNAPSDNKTATTKWAKNEMKQVSEQGIQEFVTSHEAVYATNVKISTPDNKEWTQLLKDIPTDELNAYLNEIPSNRP